ncbi:ArnT family glycosyltransferase [Tengunoibacter tsumagoiensis]|uniref:Glycosyltransferase RgtA/B/C/D-like domain-containing protein n=1 Tax=Tengunoibacter tsumagoiensis TaxID=2014871 RepID=A0A401ZUN9_9CHLR|nr:hypothetical protein [Tengunoibacter tsumagoiensis]GCE10547.1 hypothetical protein KTT_04060 [Tengunoibacter tsumagoiensis]
MQATAQRKPDTRTNDPGTTSSWWTRTDLYALLAIILATTLRIGLIALNWPPTNSDEGTMGIMALHIAYHGEHPYIYYGQNYMGVTEAYLGALFFHLFGGPSLFALRLGVVLMVTGFFINTYLLARFLFSPRVGLISVLTLSIGSIPFLTRQTIATGGSSQTLLFGSLAFLLASWLAVSYRRRASVQTILKRLLAYGGLGLTIGLGMWSDMVVLPVLAMAGLLVLLCCWRDVLTWAWLVVGVGVVIGLMPLIRYDHAQGLNAIDILLGLAHGSNSVAPNTLAGILHNIKSTFLVSMPIATGNPFCPVIEIPQLGDNSAPTASCTFAQASWGTGYGLLLGGAFLITLYKLIASFGRWREDARAVLTGRKAVSVETRDSGEDELANVVEEKRGPIARNAIVSTGARLAQLLLLLSALLALGVYIMSSGPVSWPGFHARYLISLLIATPALLEPLTQLAFVASKRRWQMWTGRAALIGIWGLLLIGTGIAFSEVPAAQVDSQQRQELISLLESKGVHHLYTNYWTCHNLAFASNEKVICASIDVKDGVLQPLHNRVPGYLDQVHGDPQASYVFPDQLPGPIPAAFQHQVSQTGLDHYRIWHIAGYIVYQPSGQ